MKKLNLLKSMLLLCALIVGSTSVWAKQYKKVTSVSELVNGAKYLIVSVETSNKYYTIGAVNSNNRTAVEVSISGEIATATVATTSGSSDAHEVQLVASSTDWNLIDVANKMYLNGGAGSNNYLRTQSSVVTDTGSGKYNGVWSISVNNETAVATIKNKNNFSIKYNSTSTLVASYTTSQTDVCLYKEIPEPTAPIIGSTWDFSSTFTQTAALNGASFTASAENTLYDTNLLSTIIYSAGSGDELNTNGYLKSNGTSGPSAKRYFILEIENSGSLELFSKSSFGTYSIRKAATASTSWSTATEIVTIVTTTEGTGVSANITYDEEKPFLFIGLSAKAYTQKINWTPTTDKVTLITTDNMDGWRAFYDASNSYSVDANTKVYVADTDPSAGVITLKKIDGIPAGVPVILYTSSSADSHKMILTKETVSPYSYTSTNKLIWTTSAVSGKYRLGYGASGVGFYPYSGTPTSGAVILDIEASAHALTIDFGEGDVTGIKNLSPALSQGEGVAYNFNGQRVNACHKGLVIVNGKKYLNK